MMHGMKSEMELADEEYEINLAKAIAVDACANEEYRQLRRAAHERLMKAEAEVQAARKAYKEICEGDANEKEGRNPLVMRDALLKASDVLTEAVHHNLTEEHINECLALIHAALSAPSEPPSNAATIREALEGIIENLSTRIELRRGNRVTMPVGEAKCLVGYARAAIAATPEPQSDADKMREALESCLNFIIRIDRAFNPFMQGLLEDAVAKANAALAAPPTND